MAKINSEIIEGVTEEMRQLQAFYLGVTNEWLEAMAVAMGGARRAAQGGEKECFPLERKGQVGVPSPSLQSSTLITQVEHISLPALYRLVCREMGQVRLVGPRYLHHAPCHTILMGGFLTSPPDFG